MANPDLELRVEGGGGGGAAFLAFVMSSFFFTQNKEGGASPRSATETEFGSWDQIKCVNRSCYCTQCRSVCR